MAPRRKKTASAMAREFKLRLPDDVSERIIAKAEKTGWPQNRVIINELADYPRLEEIGALADHVGEMGNTLARYRSEIIMHKLSGDLLDAIDALLKAEGDAVRAAIERVRVERNAMLKTEQATKRK
jgi:hypothetical protein